MKNVVDFLLKFSRISKKLVFLLTINLKLSEKKLTLNCETVTN